VCRDSSLYVGAPPYPLQPVDRPAGNTLEIGGKGDRLESAQMPTRSGLGAVLHRRRRLMGGGLPGSYKIQEVSTQIDGDREWAKRIAQVWGVYGEQRRWAYIFSLIFIHFSVFSLSLGFH